MTSVEKEEYTFSFIGGDLSLDFLNTAASSLLYSLGGEGADHFENYFDLVRWGKQAGIISEDAALQLLDKARKNPEEAGAILEEARELRLALYRIFTAVEEEQTPSAEYLAVFNKALGKAMGHARLETTGGSFAWGWDRAELPLDRMLWPVARSAADLLVSDRATRVRVCAGDTCGWMFLDLSRNHSRQWCDMRDCGNRAKAKRHYHRKREEAV